MSKVVLFNHIPKTAGSTISRILTRSSGAGDLVYVPASRSAVEEVAHRLESAPAVNVAIYTHAGCGVERYLPLTHSYLDLTFLRNPIERTVSRYFYGFDIPKSDPHWIAPGTSLSEFLETDTPGAFNAQVAFLGGLTVKHHLEGLPITREMYDRDLLEKAKQNLAGHVAFGLAERFDESVLLLRHAFEWPTWRTLYRPVNAGRTRQTSRPIAQADLDAVKASNELDMELYAFACDIFAERLAQIGNHRGQLSRFKAMNQVALHAYSSIYAPGRKLMRGSVKRVSLR
jgi:hypothetical protein